MKTGDSFHVVRRHRGRQPLGYEVYCNNVPYIKGSSQPLGRREARWIAEKLNREIGQQFVDKSEVA